ncbi:RNA recognition motif domain-containing protein [Ditylenchus destructor]|nr:RNA recognition motif domain-containing protein [Ditylenchus destructor]
MGNKLYVGNLPYGVRDNDLEQAFSQFGAVTSARVMMERDTGRSKGFGFVEMGSDAEAQAAVQGMNGQPLGGRSLVGAFFAGASLCMNIFPEHDELQGFFE